MKNKFKRLGTLITIVFICGTISTKAAENSLTNTQTKFATGLVGLSQKKLITTITNRQYPAVYTSTAQYPATFAIESSSKFDGFFEVPVGTTRTFSKVDDGDPIILYGKNKEYTVLNSVSGILFN